MKCKILAVSLSIVLAACATAQPVPLGNDTYMISQTSAGGIFKAMGSLKSDVIARANAFAESKGKVAVPVSAVESPAIPGQRMPNFEYQFRLVDKGDPRAAGGGLVKTPDMVVEVNQNAPEQPAPVQSKDTYTELLKLDDLRKRGVITDEEFATEKARILSGR